MGEGLRRAVKAAKNTGDRATRITNAKNWILMFLTEKGATLTVDIKSAFSAAHPLEKGCSVVTDALGDLAHEGRVLGVPGGGAKDSAGNIAHRNAKKWLLSRKSP